MRTARGLRAEDRREGLRGDVKREQRKARAEADVDQEVLADASGIDQSLISRMESRRCKDVATLPDLVAWLLDDECRPVGERLLRWVADAARLTVSERVSIGSDSALFRLLGESRDVGHELHREIDRALDPDGPMGSDLSTGELESVRERLIERDRCTRKLLGAVERELQGRGTIHPLHGKAVG